MGVFAARRGRRLGLLGPIFNVCRAVESFRNFLSQVPAADGADGTFGAASFFARGYFLLFRFSNFPSTISFAQVPADQIHKIQNSWAVTGLGFASSLVHLWFFGRRLVARYSALFRGLVFSSFFLVGAHLRPFRNRFAAA